MIAANESPNAATPTTSPRPGVHDEVDRAPDPEVHAAASQPVERELEPEEEEQEDDPELGDELRHLGRLDDAREPRLVGAEQQPGQQICRDGGKAEAARHEAEHGENRHRHGQLAKSQRRSLPSVRGILRLAPLGTSQVP